MEDLLTVACHFLWRAGQNKFPDAVAVSEHLDLDGAKAAATTLSEWFAMQIRFKVQPPTTCRDRRYQRLYLPCIGGMTAWMAQENARSATNITISTTC